MFFIHPHSLSALNKSCRRYVLSVTNLPLQGEGLDSTERGPRLSWDPLNFQTQMFPSVKVRGMHATSQKFFPNIMLQQVFPKEYSIENIFTMQRTANTITIQASVSIPAWGTYLPGSWTSGFRFCLLEVMGQEGWSQAGWTFGSG